MAGLMYKIIEYFKIPLELHSCVYYIKNNLNNKYYIGSTAKRLRNRISAHISFSRSLSSQYSNVKKWSEMYDDFIQQGLENFSCGVLIDFCIYPLLRKRESEFINKFDSIKKGYNKVYSCQSNHINLTDLEYIKENYKNPTQLRKVRKLYKSYITLNK